MPLSRRPPTAEISLDPPDRAARAMDAICFVSADHRILDVNARWSHLFGWDRHAARSLRLNDVAADPRALMSALEAGATGDLLDAVRGIWRHRDGHVFSGYFSIASLTLDDGLGGERRRVLCLSIRDPAAPSEVPARLGRRVERATRQQAALIGLTEAIDGDFGRRLRQILRVDAYTLEAARVSFWSLLEDGKTLRCEARFDKLGNRFEEGERRSAADLGDYLASLAHGSVLTVDDARDPAAARAIGLGGEMLLQPADLGALIAAPVFLRGQLIGTLEHEHLGSSRAWSVDEQLFAMAIAQMCSLALESHYRQLAEEDVRDSELRFRAIVEASPVPMLVTQRVGGRCLYGNAAAGETLGVPYETFSAHGAIDFYADPAERHAVLAAVDAAGHLRDHELLLKRQDDGSVFWASLSLRKVVRAGLELLVVGFVDISERKQMEQTLRHLALHDPLTGLPNRVMFYELLRREMAHARRTPAYRFALLFIDLDDFKRVNDDHGHEAGDLLLVSIANRLRACIRPHDSVARLGGDEFTVLITDITEQGEVLAIAERIATVARAPHRLGRAEVTASMSIGVVIEGAAYDDPDALLRDADGAMYRAKELGKSRYEIFDRLTAFKKEQ